jgi:hypothetical protein
MKPLSIALASLLLLSAVWAGTDVSAAPAAFAPAEGRGMKTPGPKATKQAETKVPKEKKTTKTPKPDKASFSGEVLSVDAAGLTIKTGTGDELAFFVNEETTVKIPSLGKEGTLADIRIGMRVLIRAVKTEDGTLKAVSISVSPGKPLPMHHVGVVTAYAPGASITIKAHDGNEYTFRITEETKILPAERAEELAVGRRVTIISPRDVTGGPFTAKGIVVHPEPGEGGETPGTPTPTPTPTETPTPTPTETPTPEPAVTDTKTPASE